MVDLILLKFARSLSKPQKPIENLWVLFDLAKYSYGPL